MNMRFTNRDTRTNTFGDRLLYLYNLKEKIRNGKIDFTEVATELFENNIREYSPYIPQKEKFETDSERRRQIKNTSDMLRRHIRTEDATTISGEWLNIYHMYFKCSTDFLLGYIDRPTYKHTDIAIETGLSDTAINNIVDLFTRAKAGGDSLSILNDFLSSKALFAFLLVYNTYKHPEYTTPVFSDGIEKGKVKMRPIPNDNINYPNSEPQILLAASPDNPNSFTSIPLNKYRELAAEDGLLDVIKKM